MSALYHVCSRILLIHCIYVCHLLNFYVFPLPMEKRDKLPLTLFSNVPSQQGFSAQISDRISLSASFSYFRFPPPLSCCPFLISLVFLDISFPVSFVPFFCYSTEHTKKGQSYQMCLTNKIKANLSRDRGLIAISVQP